MSASNLVLGGVSLAYCQFRWPLYRGMSPRPVEIDQPAGLYPQLKALAQGLGGGTTYLAANGPGAAGTNPGVATFYAGGVYIASVSLLNSLVCRVTLVDRRYELNRRVMDKSYRIQFGDGYMNGTELTTYREALEDIVGSIDLLSASLASDAYDSVPDRNLPEDLLLDGLPLLTALGSLGESGGFDLCVNWRGEYYFASREEPSAASLPSEGGYSWHELPGWVTEDSVQLQRPRDLKVYATERHCVRFEAVDDQSSIAHNGPEELRIEGEWVYSSNGEIYTLPELLVAYGYNFNSLTEQEIANVIMTDTFQGTSLEVDGTANNRAVIDAIKSDWRRLLRINFVGRNGTLGGWTDWAFGKINDDGSTADVAVECPWVEFLNVLDLPENAHTTINAHMTVNHPSPAPFTADWEMGPEAGVIRLRQKALPDGNFALPGELIEPLRCKVKPSVETSEGESIPLDGYEIVEMEERGKARFKSSFRLAIYLCATRRAPNDETRWHLDTIEGYADGDIEDVEIPPGNQLCIRDYVGTDRPAQADGLGPVLNADILKTDAERRAEAWKIAFGQAAGGEGVAESVALATDWKVDGAISEIIVEGTIEGPSVQVVRTRVKVGGLIDADAIDYRAAIIVKERGVKEAGKNIA